VDFLPACVAMAAYVKRAAALLGATVSLVHVVDPTGYNGLQLYVRPISEVSEEHLGIGRERLDSFLRAEFPVAQCPRILASGDAATEIARVAREDRFDLIIMPTHSGIFREMLLDSTTAEVINDADCPV
jgi:nucleotide-binding universal stress UspA family protein